MKPLILSILAISSMSFADESFQISEKATETLGIEFVKFVDTKSLPKSAYVAIKDRSGVYRRLKDSITLVSPSELKRGDEVAISGTVFLRLVEADHQSGEVGHGH